MLAALRIRRDAGIAPDAPLSIYDFVEKEGVGLWFSEIPSLEGLYCPSPTPTIILNSERPDGRKAFTCAHELGHHVFGHGTVVDTGDNKIYSDDDNEFLVDCFAGYALMPKTAICSSFLQRGWDFRNPTPLQIYCIANQFGVGYSTLIHHLRFSLGLISREPAETLLNTRLPEIRKTLGAPPNTPLVVVDQFWMGRPVDLNVKDTILVPRGAHFEGSCLIHSSTVSSGELMNAILPGLGKLSLPDRNWSTFVRVSRCGFTGRSSYRFLEESDGE